MEGLCKNCYSWTALLTKRFSGYEDALPTIQGKCSCEKFVYDKLELPEIAPDLLLYWDDDNYSVSFTTGGYFGCIHFKVRP